MTVLGKNIFILKNFLILQSGSVFLAIIPLLTLPNIKISDINKTTMSIILNIRSIVRIGQLLPAAII